MNLERERDGHDEGKKLKARQKKKTWFVEVYKSRQKYIEVLHSERRRGKKNETKKYWNEK